MVKEIETILEGNSGMIWSDESDIDIVPAAATGGVLGAKLGTPVKTLTKKGVAEGALAKRKGIRKTTSLEELTKSIQQDRMKKAREKERMEEAGWKRIDNIQNWRWDYFRVPEEKRLLMIDLPATRRSFSRLAIFSLYFTDIFLSYLINQREAEMAAHWSSSGFAIRVNLKVIKQVREKRKKERKKIRVHTQIDVLQWHSGE